MADTLVERQEDSLKQSQTALDLGTKRFRPHLVLGDAQAYEQAVARASKAAEPPAPQGLDAFDPSTVPKDIWDAANLVADRGVDIVRAYVHLCRERQTIKQLLEDSFARNSASGANTTAMAAPGATFSSTTASPGDTVSFGDAGRVAPGQLLTKATVEDYIRAGHNERVVQRWRAQLLQWAQVEADLMATTGKKQDQLTLNRGETWRHKMEVEASLDAAKLARAEASTPAAWNMALRSAHERYVMIGNIFSGLFLPVRESASPHLALTTIKRPSGPPTAPLVSTIYASRQSPGPDLGSGFRHDSPDMHTQQRLGSSDAPKGATAAARGGSGFSGPRSPRTHATRSPSPGRHQGHSVTSGLGRGTRAGATGRHSPLRGSAGGQQQQQHKPFAHARGFRQPEERGRRWQDSEYLEEAFRTVRQGVKDAGSFAADVEGLEVVGHGLEEDLWGVCQRDVGLADVEAFLVHADKQLLREFQVARRAREAAEAAAAAEAASAAAKAAERAAAQQLPKPGPHLEAAAERLPFFCLPGCSQTAVLPVQNIGTAAVYYSWGSSPVRATHGSSSGSSGSSSSSNSLRPDEQRFYQPDQKGVILPGELKEFSFMFKSQLPGTFSELWTLNTTPPLSGRGKHGDITVLLRGVAASADATSSARSCLEAELAEAERTRKVCAVIEGMLRGLVTKPVLQPPVLNATAADTSSSSSTSSNTGSSDPSSSGIASSTSSSSGTSARPAGEAERWMAANDRQHPAAYYSPAVAAKLEGLYGRARAVLASEVVAVQAALAEAKKARKKPDDPSLEQLPPDFPAAWDCSVDTLMSAIDALDARRGFPPRQLAALLRKQAGAVLVEARQPDCRRRMVAVACRRAVLELASAVPTAAVVARAAAYPNARATHGGNASASSHGSSHGKHPAARMSTAGAGPASPGLSPGPSVATAGDAAGLHRTGSVDAAALYAETLSSAVAEAVAAAVAQIEPWIAEQRADVAAHLDGKAEAAAGQLRQLEEAGVDGTDDLVEEVAWRRFSLLRAKQQLGCE